MKAKPYTVLSQRILSLKVITVGPHIICMVLPTSLHMCVGLLAVMCSGHPSRVMNKPLPISGRAHVKGTLVLSASSGSANHRTPEEENFALASTRDTQSYVYKQKMTALVIYYSKI